MTTINFNINDGKEGPSTSGDQFSDENIPVPTMAVTGFSGIDESMPAPQSFEQDNLSAIDGDESPRPENFENLQNSDNGFIPSPIQEEDTMNLEGGREMHPSPMDFEELNDIKATKKTTRASTSKSTKK